MSKTTAPRSIAVLGIGIIGAAVARNLVRKGFAVRVWNRTPEKALVLAADGVEVFHNPADALR
ncbi:NAD(P)-binding domain-containing protein, partial [Klebsiella oxytoca]|uniref:NAD(P)-binding domain-containing protein n=1 Tax=Klebsiella oxytoca TaxID=571 RepID=UPI0013D66BDE